MGDILALSEIGREDLERVGGKALNLAVLSRAGFPVPPAVVVPVEAYEAFLDANGLREAIEGIVGSTDLSDDRGVRAASKRIKGLIMEGGLGDGLADRMLSAVREMGGEAMWAVRSSAVAEDMPTASFAGQQDTFLNVPAGGVVEHVKRCWASYWNDRALAYRNDARIPQLGTGIAVVVQRMVDPVASGIMFTADPVNGGKGAIIESSWGLGEAIASGLVCPDRFVCDTDCARVVSSDVSRKTKGLFRRDGRTVELDIEEGRRSLPSLEEESVLELAVVGRRIEDFFGAPQDIEWAVEGDDIFILQSRPITTLNGDDLLWTRAYGDEYWADVTTPLFFSLLGEWLTDIVNHEGARIMGYKELVDTDLLRLHKGHIYFNCEVLEQVFTYNPKFSRTKELLNYFPVTHQERIGNARTKALRRLWAEVRIMVLDPDGRIGRTDAAYREWAASFIEAMAPFDALDLARLSDEELRQQYLYIERSMIKHYRLIRYGMVTHSIGTNLMVKRWLESWLDDRHGELYSKLISGLPDNKTIQTNIGLAALAMEAQADASVMAALDRWSSGDFLARLEEFPAFDASLGRFLAEYGHRAHTREIYFPRWAEDPSRVVDIVKALVSSPVADLGEVERRKAEERARAEREILGRISALRHGWIKKRVFAKVLGYAQTYLIFRENQRFYLDHILLRERRLFMEYGRRFVERGLLERGEDVFFLSKEEVFDLAAKGEEVMGTVHQRRREFERYSDILPPKFVRGNVEFDDTLVREGDTTSITGTSASPGLYRGRVRVVASIEQLHEVREGEVLVTSNTDPGWTAVFSKLGGLVTETGGILSHGAVVSREYGIPAVTAVKNATELLSTGQTVTLDGNDGIIYLEE